MSEYGEPWSAYNMDEVLDNVGDVVADFYGQAEHLKRSIACVNALAGVEDEYLPTIMQEVRACLNAVLPHLDDIARSTSFHRLEAAEKGQAIRSLLTKLNAKEKA